MTTLVAALAELGLQAMVRPDGSCATIELAVPSNHGTSAPLVEPRVRASIVAAARRCGFTHVALELPHAPIRRVEPA